MFVLSESKEVGLVEVLIDVVQNSLEFSNKRTLDKVLVC